MNILTSQRGVGLIEVLVAVLLLSIAVLGFSALQMRAISATDESLVRTKSLTLVRNLAEVMRTYPDGYVTSNGTVFTTVLADKANAEPIVQAIATIPTLSTEASSYYSVKVDGTEISIAGSNNCYSTTTVKNAKNELVPSQICSTNQLAALDTLLVKQMAREENIELAVVECPADTGQQAIQQHMCIITAWNGTKPLLIDDDKGNNSNACADSKGVYKIGSQCLISEAY